MFEYDGETHNIAIPENVYANHESVLSVNYAYSTDDGTTWTSTTGDIPANVTKETYQILTKLLKI